ncbi:MAG: peptidase domain-containing ABC transporter [Bacteroidota bacterium]
MKFPFYKQHDSTDCGPACLKMVCAYHGKHFSVSRLRTASHITREGVSMLGISDAAESVGMQTMGVNLSFEELVESSPFPCIAHWQQNHFVVICKIAKKANGYFIKVADPAHGLITYRENEFLRAWQSGPDSGGKGICLLLEPGDEFAAMPEDSKNKRIPAFVRQYLRPYRSRMSWLIILMLIASSLQFAFPWLTQKIVDKGIANKDIGYVSLVVMGQLALFFGLISMEFFRSRALVFISNRININMVSDFLKKLLRLPMSFFSSKLPGDLIQRISDHQRIQSFITTGMLNILFSMLTMVVFGIVLAIYSPLVLAVFVLSSVLYAVWVYFFMNKRKELDYIRFSKLSNNQDTLLQIIHGMPEIKLTNSEDIKRKEWEKIQESLFEIQIKSLKISQYQDLGSFFFLRTKDIVITFITAWLVIRGQLTLGMMLAIQFILGQLNAPVEQFVSFIREMQDASISMDRIEEVNTVEDEEKEGEPLIRSIGDFKGITIENLCFQYEGPHSPMVLDNLNLTIPANKVTAIVGMSGSGKTTLVKLLLSFYLPVRGRILINDTPLTDISNRYWRSNCGSVMQDGYIFSDTIEENITLGDNSPDKEKLSKAITLANLEDFLNTFPRGLQTKVGQDGAGLSQGQKQRILIARAVYRNPKVLFFDEATNALDASNERIIMERLDDFYKGRTVVIVAHRLSTVKNADQIVVLSKGKVMELGTHKELISKKGIYFDLVSDQLEIGK